MQAVVEAAADSLRPCPAAPRAEASPAAAPSTGSHPAPPVGITASSGLQPPAAAPTAGLGSTSGSFLLPAAQRAGSLLACFELVFSNEHLLQALGRRLTTGSLISLKLFQGALQGVGMHYGVPTPAGGWCEQGLQVLQAAYAAAASPAGGGCMGTSQQDNEPMQRTLYHLDKQCMQRALCQLADELVQQLLPQLARHPAGLPAQLVPDDGGSSNGGSRAGRGSGGGGGSTSIICCCRRFGATNSCQARHAPGVSGGGQAAICRCQPAICWCEPAELSEPAEPAGACASVPAGLPHASQLPSWAGLLCLLPLLFSPPTHLAIDPCTARTPPSFCI